MWVAVCVSESDTSGVRFWHVSDTFLARFWGRFLTSFSDTFLRWRNQLDWKIDDLSIELKTPSKKSRLLKGLDGLWVNVHLFQKLPRGLVKNYHFFDVKNDVSDVVFWPFLRSVSCQFRVSFVSPRHMSHLCQNHVAKRIIYAIRIEKNTFLSIETINYAIHSIKRKIIEKMTRIDKLLKKTRFYR